MSLISGSQTFRGVALGAQLLSSSPAKCSVSKRRIQVSTVGRETCKKRLIRTLLQPCVYSLMACTRTWYRSGRERESRRGSCVGVGTTLCCQRVFTVL